MSNEVTISVTDQDNSHLRTSTNLIVDGNQRLYEFIHQQRSGDCVLINFLNTWSFVHDGVIPMSVNEARLGVMNLRHDEGISTESIKKIDSGLSQEDVVLLFSLMSDTEPNWEEDVLQIDGRVDMRKLQLIVLDILDYLDTYSSGRCITGLREHSTTIVKLKGDSYAFLDPFDPQGATFHDTAGMVELLANLIENRSQENNFFYFVRGNIRAASTPFTEVSS